MTDREVTTERLWHELGVDLRRFIELRVSDRQAASDLLQDVFLRIHNRLGSLGDSDRIHAWVYRIARNAIVDYYRTLSRPAKPATEADRIAAPAAGDNLNREVSGWLDSMVDELPETYRDAIRLSEIEGWRQSAVAQRLGISISGAKSRIQRGRELLKESLLDCCHFDLDRRGNVVAYERRRGGTACGEKCDG